MLKGVTYKGKAVKVQEVSRELGVRYVLEGSVRKAGDQVRITAQLIDATTDRHLWAERYDRPLTDIFALQDAVVQKIVTTLKLQLSLQEQGVLARKPQENLEAYDAFLQGLAYFHRFTKEGNAQARQLFEHAVALDPAYAEAYAWLGATYGWDWGNRWSQDPRALERTVELAYKALALDDTLSWPHALLGWSYLWKQQPEQALAEAERAIALEPSNADSYAVQGEMLIYAGRPEAALRSLEKALRLNPHAPVWYLQSLGRASLYTGRYTEAITALKTLLLRNPQTELAYIFLASAYVAQWAAQLSHDPQTLEQALAAAQKAVALNDSWSLTHAALGHVYLRQQQYEPALTEMERAALEPRPGTAASNIAGLAEGLSRVGRLEEALEAAEKALRLQSLVVDIHLGRVGSAYALAGQPAEALAPLQRLLSRYPDNLPANLTLVAVYSELGREAEARTEAAEVLRLNPHFSLDVYRQREPLKDPAQLERQLAGLRRAGLR